MSTDTEFKDFIIKHRAEILKNDWESVYNDLSSYLDVSNLTNFLLNKVHINPLYYMTSVPRDFARELDITSINIPNNITSIRESAFQNCTSLTSITIPDGVTEIDDFAFSNCISLTSVTIPSSVTRIRSNTFINCSSLTSITIPNNVTKIENSAFYNCSSLTSITIPNSVESIGEFAFENCTGLTSVTIPSSVKRIRYHVFTGCDNLKEIKYTGTQQQWDNLLSLVASRDFAKWIYENKVKIIFI